MPDENDADFDVQYERVDDINAEIWEQLAADLPSSMNDFAKLYLDIAKRYRQSGDQKTVPIRRKRLSLRNEQQ